jgi:putative exosortase-associated protein (TIGR04073 family)
MRNILSLCALAGLAAIMGTGCAGPEKKLGRGLSNSFELVRGGEMRRSLEQTAVFERKTSSTATAFIHGLNKSLARTGMGIYEIITFPIPPYDPIGKNYVKPGRVYPDNYQPRVMDDSLYATDTALGFSGGDVAPIVPGSRFHVFDN